MLFFWVWVRKWCDRVYWTAIESPLEDGDDNVDIYMYSVSDKTFVLFAL